MNRLRHDDNGDAATSMLILVVIALIVWQFILPSFGYTSLSDTLGATDPEPDVITFSYGLKFNAEYVTIDSTVADFSSIDRVPDYYPAYDIDNNLEIPDYTFVVQTNAPSRLTSPYSIRVKSIIYESDGFSETETNLLYAEINAFSGSGVKEFNVPFDNEYISQTTTEYTDVIATLYAPSGNALETLHLVIV